MDCHTYWRVGWLGRWSTMTGQRDCLSGLAHCIVAHVNSRDPESEGGSLGSPPSFSGYGCDELGGLGLGVGRREEGLSWFG